MEIPRRQQGTVAQEMWGCSMPCRISNRELHRPCNSTSRGQGTMGLRKLRPRPDVQFLHDARSREEYGPMTRFPSHEALSLYRQPSSVASPHESQAAEKPGKLWSKQGATNQQEKLLVLPPWRLHPNLLANIYIPPGSPAAQHLDHILILLDIVAREIALPIVCVKRLAIESRRESSPPEAFRIPTRHACFARLAGVGIQHRTHTALHDDTLTHIKMNGKRTPTSGKNQPAS